MSDYGVKNCTLLEREQLRIKLHSYCQEGGYCRVMPPNHLYCQCLQGWKNDICDTPDMLGSADLKMVVVIPLVVLAVLILIGVVIFFVVRRHRQKQSEKERNRREQTTNPMVNRLGNQPIYNRPPSGSAGVPAWNCETGPQQHQDKEYLA